MRIIVSGGLGNQMFQYALYLALKEKGRNVKLDTSLYSHVEMHNGYELERCFCVNEQYSSQSSINKLVLKLMLKYKPEFLVYSDKMKCYKFSKDIFKTKAIIIDGYWQSEKYFRDIRRVIFKKFQFRNIDSVNSLKADEIKSCCSVSMHFRFGDYVDNWIYKDICNEDYYLKAIELILENSSIVENPKFYIFSNDTDKTKNFISRIKIDYEIVCINNGKNSYKDMYLMSLCKHNIIANSSFSWWGAWLNQNEEKVVIAPNKWTNTNNNSGDIFPIEWIRL